VGVKLRPGTTYRFGKASFHKNDLSSSVFALFLSNGTVKISLELLGDPPEAIQGNAILTIKVYKKRRSVTVNALVNGVNYSACYPFSTFCGLLT
jgi:hypothetical protein